MEILFDLDGTLIDSSPGILASFQRVLDANGLRAVVPLEASLIGPPLGETLQRISGIEDDAVLSRLTEAFKQDYDTTGYRQTLAFVGVPEGLQQLSDGGSRLFIVTNKRMVPTRKILAELDLARYFTGVHTRDETVPMASSKSAVTKRVIAQYAIDPDNAFFVGDSDEDALAARGNQLLFIHAGYGYGMTTSSQTACAAMLGNFEQLVALVDMSGLAKNKKMPHKVISRN